MPVHLTPRAEAYSNQAPPTGANLQNVVAWLQPQLLETIVELAQRGDVEGFIGARVNALRVTGGDRIEKTQEEFGLHVIVSNYGPLVGAHLPEQQRLDEPPRFRQQVEILHRSAQLERLQHVAIEIEIAGKIGVCDAAFVDAGDGPQRIWILERHAERRRAVPKKLR